MLKNIIFYDKITNSPRIRSNNLLWCSEYDLRVRRYRSCVRIPLTNSFLFFNSKIFYDLFKFPDFLRSLDRFKVLIGVNISEFYIALRKISLQYLLIGGVNVCPPHVKTVSTSLMSKLVKLSKNSNL